MIVEYRIYRLVRLAKANPNKRFNRLLREIAKPEFLMYAFEQIKDNKGSNTPGIDGKTKRHWNISEAADAAESLRNGTYRPTPVRRVYIPKKNGKLRPLGIPTFTDRVVQSAIKLVLEALYEPIFLDSSHGFRPARACHTALNVICDSPKTRIDWVVEGDIKGFFDNVAHQVLIRLLQKRISDDRFLKLIAKFLKAGYFEREMWNPTKKGTPQGGIVSPILANIYLHELDKYVVEKYETDREYKQTRAEVAARVNPEYNKIRSKMNFIRKVLSGKQTSPQSEAELRAQLRECLKRRKTTPFLVEPIKPRIAYVRYADDWVITLRNLPKARAEEIKSDITQWVEENLRLELSPEKTLITHIADGFIFLGHKIMPAKRKQKGSQPQVKLVVPHDSVKAKIDAIHMECRNCHKSEIDVLRRVNSILTGWMDFYCCVTSPSRTFQKVIQSAYWSYGNYVAKKNDISFRKAAGKWIARCKATRQNPRGNQKTWFAERTCKNGKRKREYLICSTTKKRDLRDVTSQIRRYGYRFDMYETET